MTYAGPTLGERVILWMADELGFIPTAEQCDIILRWYAVDRDSGEYLYRRGGIEMAKGWGKSPLAAAIALAEFVGPVVFDYWQGTVPFGRPWVNPWVQIAAVSEDQTDNTYHAIHDFLAPDDGRVAKRLGIDLGLTRLHLVGRPGVLEPVTAAAGSREGQRLTFAILDETHLWTRRNGGIKLAGTLRRNAAKMGGRTMETTNAPLLGEKSVAEQSGLDAGVLHYARRPPVEPVPEWSDEQLLESLKATYGDASWIDLHRILAEIRDPATSWDDSIRFYFNIRSAGAGRAVDPRVWDALAVPQDVPAGTPIGLGFDGSISRDATVLRGCTRDGYSFLIGAWVRPKDAPDDWSVDRISVGEAIEEAFARYTVGLLICDPPKWYTEVARWSERWPDRVIALETNQARRFAPPTDRWLTALREGTHTHDNDPLTNLHVKASHLRKVRLADEEDDGRTRYVLIKGDDGGRIDAAVADVLAYEAAMTMPEEPPASEAKFIPMFDPPPTGPRTFEEEQAELARFFGDDD